MKQATVYIEYSAGMMFFLLAKLEVNILLPFSWRIPWVWIRIVCESVIINTMRLLKG